MTTPTPALSAATNSSAWLRPPVVILLLIALWAFAYLPELGARDFRLEEGRRATPAWEMLHTGDFLVPRLYGQIYLSKPPLYFWLVAGAKSVLGGPSDENAARWQWATRLPSALGALLGAFILLAFARRTLPWHARILAALAWLASATLLDKGTLGEIDAPLSSLVLLSLALWYDPFDRDPSTTRPTLAHWTASGLVMALAVLLKGPGGPLEFYPMIGLFLLWHAGLRKTARCLLSPAHLLFILLSAAPTLLWVALLLARTHLSLHDLTHIWGEQTALDEIGVMRPQAYAERFPWSRYATFLPELFTMTLPWSLWALAALLPPVARWAGLLSSPGNPSPPPPRITALYRFAAAGILGITVIFYLYPGAQTRHMMAVAFPITLMAALLIASPRAAEKLRPLAPALATASGIMAIIPAIAGFVALAAALFLPKAHGLVPIAATIAAAGLLITLLAIRNANRIPTLQQATWVGITLSLTVLAGRAAAAAVFLPIKAPSDITAIDHRQIDALLDPALPAYTTKTFTTRRGDGYYNILFYVHLRTAATGGLHALPAWTFTPALPPPPAKASASAPASPTTAPVLSMPCSLLGSPDELSTVADRFSASLQPQGTIGVAGRDPPPILTARLSIYKDRPSTAPPDPAPAPHTSPR
ncbi:MAG TPA: glycosyltransferase family 39 protein [Phycisphaerae bacterium]|nr:glycosyltransferase family 39 protein [Phycisphaerae bacterium]